MGRLVVLSLVLIALVSTGCMPGMAAPAAVNYFDDFSREHDSGWARSDAAPFYAVIDQEYQIYNYGGGDTYSTRPDLALPSHWKFSVDVRTYRPGLWPGSEGFGGVALVAASNDPWINSIRVNIVYHASQDRIAIQIHKGDSADLSSYIPYTEGDVVHLVVVREEGSGQITATLTSPGGTLTLTSTGDLSAKLDACKLPGLQVGGGVYAYYLFDNISISSLPEVSPVFGDDFSSGDDTNWARSDAVPFYSVVGEQYQIDNYGGGPTYSTRPDVTMPDNWVCDMDVAAYRPNPGVLAQGGFALVADSSNPWQNYILVNVCVHETLDLVGLQVHWQDDAAPINWVPYSQGDKVHLTVARAAGSNVISAVLTAPGGTLYATSADLTAKLAACRTPGVQVGGGASAVYLFDNISVVSPVGLTRTYLSVNGVYGTLQYADGFRDDKQIVNVHGGNIVAGAVHQQGDKFYRDAVEVGKWRVGSTELGSFSTDPNNAIIYRISLPENGASGYLISGANIHFGTMVYQHDGQVSLFVSKDGVVWSPSLRTDANTVDGWRWRYNNVAVPAEYCGGEVLYIKMTGSCPDANNWASIDEWGVRLNLKAADQVQLIDRYLSITGDTGVYKYASGFGDDHNIPSHTAIDFTGAINDNADKYLIDAYALGTWSRNGTALGAFSSNINNAAIYKFSMPREGAPGYSITGGQIYLGTRIYQKDARVSLYVSRDGTTWSQSLQTDMNEFNGWESRYHDIAIPSAYTGGDTIYVKIAGGCPDANDWASVDEWGISLTLEGAAQPVAMISDLASLKDGSVVQVTDPKVVTVASGTFTDGSGYVEEPDRAGGIRITGAVGLSVGDSITVTGTLGTDTSGERYIAVSSVDSQTSGLALRPLGMNNRSAETPMSRGLLLTVWGRVTYVAPDVSYFYVDDGSALSDGSEHTGVRIETGGLATPLTNVFTGSPYVAITGVAGSASDGDLSVRVVRPRSDSDVTSF